MTARKPNRLPRGGSNIGGNGQIDFIDGWTHPLEVTKTTEFRMSPLGESLCNDTSDMRVKFQPIQFFKIIVSVLQYIA